MPSSALSTQTRRARVMNWHASTAVSLSASMAVSNSPHAQGAPSALDSRSFSVPARPSLARQRLTLSPASPPRVLRGVFRVKWRSGTTMTENTVGTCGIQLAIMIRFNVCFLRRAEVHAVCNVTCHSCFNEKCSYG